MYIPTAVWISCDQMLKAAENGQSDEVVELLNEGAGIEFKDHVRHVYFFLYKLLESESICSP